MSSQAKASPPESIVTGESGVANVQPAALTPISWYGTFGNAAAMTTPQKNKDLTIQLSLATVVRAAYEMDSIAYMYWPLIRCNALEAVAAAAKRCAENTISVTDHKNPLLADISALHAIESGITGLDNLISRTAGVVTHPPHTEHINSAVAELADEDRAGTALALELSAAISSLVPRRLETLRRWNPEGYEALAAGLDMAVEFSSAPALSSGN